MCLRILLQLFPKSFNPKTSDLGLNLKPTPHVDAGFTWLRYNYVTQANTPDGHMSMFVGFFFPRMSPPKAVRRSGEPFIAFYSHKLA